MSEVPTEQVLVVPTELLHQLGYFQGFLPGAEGYLDTLLSPQHTSYRPRSEMEADPSFKQLIPYVIFCHRDAAGNLSVFRYTRGTGQGEQRLHSKHSVGIGGHISSDDAVKQALRRRDAARAGRRSDHQHALHGSLRGLDQRRRNGSGKGASGRGAYL